MNREALRWEALGPPVRIGGKIYYDCRCGCGRHRRVVAGNIWRGGSTQCQSCARKTHGLSESREYRIWKGIRRRCYSPDSDEYHNYGGRGITLAPEWHDFERFLADMGKRPSPRHSIDRIDNDRGYGPGNCRWADSVEQARNRRPTVNRVCGVGVGPSGRWRATIGIAKRTLYIGTYDDWFEAVCARKSAENKLWRVPE